MKKDECKIYWDSVVDTMMEGLFIVDTEGTILTINPAAEKITGYSREEVIGRQCTVFESDTCMLSTPAGNVKRCRLFEKGRVVQKKCVLRRKNGTHVHLLKNATVLRDRTGEIIGGVETLTDVTPLMEKDREISSLRKAINKETGFHGIIGNTQPMRRLFDMIESSAQSSAPVIIYGESGTGKELVAEAVHNLSPRRKNPFLKVNCAAINESLFESELFGHVKGAFTGADTNRTGRFEAAGGGSLFLDEVGDIPLSVQVKLLRVLQEQEIERVGDHNPIPIDVRIISATNKNLLDCLEKEKIREDLFYRLNVVPLEIPPLRKRSGDIPLLVDAFTKRIALRSGCTPPVMTPKAMDTLLAYRWPGNVRELINVLEYIFVTCKGLTIGVEHLPAHLNMKKGVSRSAPRRNSGEDSGERQKILKALDTAGGNRTQAAEALGVSRVTLWKKMKKYEITPNYGG